MVATIFLSHKKTFMNTRKPKKIDTNVLCRDMYVVRGLGFFGALILCSKAVADLGFHEGGFVRSGALARP